MNLRIKDGSLERILTACLRLLGFSELLSVSQKGEVRFPIGPAYSRLERLQSTWCWGGNVFPRAPAENPGRCLAHERAVHDA